MKRFASMLLLACPLVVTLALEAAVSARTIDIRLSRHGFSPERIEVRLGERVRLNVASIDGTHGFRVRALGLNARIPDDGRTVTLLLTPRETGTFQITCSESCESGHSRMTDSLVVTPP